MSIRERMTEFHRSMDLRDRFFTYGAAAGLGGIAIIGGEALVDALFEVPNFVSTAADITGRSLMIGGVAAAVLSQPPEVFGKD